MLVAWIFEYANINEILKLDEINNFHGKYNWLNLIPEETQVSYRWKLYVPISIKEIEKALNE